MTAKAPEITACEAITAAMAASTTIGPLPQSGIIRKNGFSFADGEPRINAPWPR